MKIFQKNFLKEMGNNNFNKEKALKKTIFTLFKVVSIVYILICTLVYFYQENLIFSLTKIAKSHTYFFNQKFEEFNFKKTQ